MSREKDESLLSQSGVSFAVDTDLDDEIISNQAVSTGPPGGVVRPESRTGKKSFRPYYEINRQELKQRIQNRDGCLPDNSLPDSRECITEDRTNRTPMIRTPIGTATETQPTQENNEDLELIPSTEKFYKETYQDVS